MVSKAKDVSSVLLAVGDCTSFMRGDVIRASIQFCTGIFSKMLHF